MKYLRFMNPRLHQSNILIYKKSKSHMSFDLEHLMYYLRLTSEHKQSNNNETANWAESGKHQFGSEPSEILNLRSSTTYSRNCILHATLIPNLVKPLTYIHKSVVRKVPNCVYVVIECSRRKPSVEKR